MQYEIEIGIISIYRRFHTFPQLLVLRWTLKFPTPSMRLNLQAACSVSFLDSSVSVYTLFTYNKMRLPPEGVLHQQENVQGVGTGNRNTRNTLGNRHCGVDKVKLAQPQLVTTPCWSINLNYVSNNNVTAFGRSIASCGGVCFEFDSTNFYNLHACSWLSCNKPSQSACSRESMNKALKLHLL